jgi:hypothetical protein
MHWHKRNRLKKQWRWAILCETNTVPRPATGKRAVTILSYRKRRITDHANLVGGAKLVVDAIRDAGLIVDDSDKWMVAAYKQELASKSPYPFDGKESTVISIEHFPEPTPETP